MLGRVLLGFVLALITYVLLNLIINDLWSGLAALIVFVIVVWGDNDGVRRI